MDGVSLCVSNAQIGAVLGQGGSRVNQIRTETSCEVSIENGAPRVQNRRIDVKGASYLDAVCQILGTLADSGEADVKMHLLVSHHHLGALLDGEGKLLPAISEAYPRLTMVVERGPLHTGRPLVNEQAVCFSGTIEDIQQGVLQMLNVIETAIASGTLPAVPMPSSGEKRPRPPGGFNPHASIPPALRHQVAATQGGVATTVMPPLNMAMGGIQGLPMAQHQHAHQGRLPHGCPPGGMLVETPQLCLVLADEHAGKVIGKGGGNITQLRQQTGCKFDMEPSQGRGVPRILKVSGSLDQLHVAVAAIKPVVEDIN